MVRLLQALTATAVALTAMTLGAGDAAAYEWYRAASADKPMRWHRPELTFAVSHIDPVEVPLWKVREVLQQAADSWSDLPGCRVPTIQVVEKERRVSTITTPNSLDDEPDNVVVFVKSKSAWGRLPGASASQIALTFLSHDPNTGEIIDADIAVNDAWFTFTYRDTDVTEYSVDLLAALTHELGHFYGMEHSAEQDATMFANYGHTVETKLDARTLHPDDTEGVCALYADAPMGPTGTDGPDDPGTDEPPLDSGCGAAPAPPWSLAGALALGWLGLALRRRRRQTRRQG